jgi:Flp pilus assembly CpaE family ATPase
MQNTATPLVLEDSPISRQIKEMARSVTGQQEAPAKKKGFSLFG